MIVPNIMREDNQVEQTIDQLIAVHESCKPRGATPRDYVQVRAWSGGGVGAWGGGALVGAGVGACVTVAQAGGGGRGRGGRGMFAQALD